MHCKGLAKAESSDFAAVLSKNCFAQAPLSGSSSSSGTAISFKERCDWVLAANVDDNVAHFARVLGKTNHASCMNQRVLRIDGAILFMPRGQGFTNLASMLLKQNTA